MFFNIVPVPAGTLISVPTHLVYRHFGIVTARGTVISNSARHKGAREEPLDDFCCGRQWQIEPRPSDLPWWEVLHRARQLMTRPYKLFTWNCESFYKTCYGLPATSDQVTISVLVAAAGMIATVALSAGE
jgi:hypothetical protein